MRRTPTVLMIDDADHLHAQASLDVIASLMLHLPPSMRLAVASRHRLSLPWARLEVAGRLLELDAQALALDASDAAAMAAAMGVPTSSERVASLVDQTEGWPAAIYLGLRAVGSTLAQGRSEDELRGTERIHGGIHALRADRTAGRRLAALAASLLRPRNHDGPPLRRRPRHDRVACAPARVRGSEHARRPARSASPRLPLPSPVPRHAA